MRPLPNPALRGRRGRMLGSGSRVSLWLVHSCPSLQRFLLTAWMCLGCLLSPGSEGPASTILKVCEHSLTPAPAPPSTADSETEQEGGGSRSPPPHTSGSPPRVSAFLQPERIRFAGAPPLSNLSELETNTKHLYYHHVAAIHLLVKAGKFGLLIPRTLREEGELLEKEARRQSPDQPRGRENEGAGQQGSDIAGAAPGKQRCPEKLPMGAPPAPTARLCTRRVPRAPSASGNGSLIAASRGHPLGSLTQGFPSPHTHFFLTQITESLSRNKMQNKAKKKKHASSSVRKQ